MIYTVKRGKSMIRLGKGRDAVATKREAIVIRNHIQSLHPRMKGLRIVKLRIRR